MDSFTSEFEFGDEVILAVHPPNRLWILTDFLFEYFGDFTPQGDEKARIRIYLNDGPSEKKYPPTTLLFDSGEFPISPQYQIGSFSGLNITLPDDPTWTRVTWTVQFSGMRNVKGDRASVILRPETAAGHNFKDFWLNDQNGWGLKTLEPANPNFPVDPITNPDPIEKFGARMYGIPSPPSAQPKLNIQREDDSLVLQWTGPARLQTSDRAVGGYSDLQGVISPYRVKIDSEPFRFWRLAN
ncbi:MAG: hypothetical protein L0Z50_11125 [Verrucomicrobiales bacterium]|nr:hypothetical protein [Verrucomicrobiales bacterium]